MPVKNSTEYMRKYRASKKLGGEPTIAQEVAAEPEVNRVPALEALVEEQAAEIKRLKQLLATKAERPVSQSEVRLSTVVAKPALDALGNRRPQPRPLPEQIFDPSFGAPRPAPRESAKKS